MSGSDPTCAAKGIPPHLHRLSRAVIAEFLKDERLFIRFKPDVQLVDGKPPNTIFNPDEQSMVREKLANTPEDVLYDINGPPHLLNWGIVELQVSQIETLAKEISDPTKREFTFKVSHEPEDCCYPHSEIHIFENGNRVREVRPKSVRSYIREELLKRCSITQRPT